MTMDRSEALARLAALGAHNDLSTPAAPEPKLELTGDEVYAGGTEARVLIRSANLTYREEKGGELLYAAAKVGDTVLLDKAQAKRLDGLGATVTKTAANKAAKTEPAPVVVPSVPGEEPEGEQLDPLGTLPEGMVAKTDEELAAMGAQELVAHVNQHNEDKVRVRALEGQRSQPRATVLRATAPEGDDPDEELD